VPESTAANPQKGAGGEKRSASSQGIASRGFNRPRESSKAISWTLRSRARRRLIPFRPLSTLQCWHRERRLDITTRRVLGASFPRHPCNRLKTDDRAAARKQHDSGPLPETLADHLSLTTWRLGHLWLAGRSIGCATLSPIAFLSRLSPGTLATHIRRTLE
jgi:hypothetical protein